MANVAQNSIENLIKYTVLDDAFMEAGALVSR